eukprot:TRINITY_DN3976_c1_g1_i1.p1 TRINITY_DN3976_c1_g1~~TRINITY_DN3976_c1_g1_i1.p1  ORF type:complete len:175 (-),score=27.38 TRINITY_DN3976_c1_g1_i1:16-540(-)
MQRLEVTVVGSHAVGKTSIAFRFIDDYFQDTPYDAGIMHQDPITATIKVDDEVCYLDIHDASSFGSQEKRDPRSRKAKKPTVGVLLVYDVTSRSSFEDIKSLRESVFRSRDLDSQKHRIPMVIVGNKCDAEKQRVVSIREAQRLAAELDCPFIETSAKENINIEEIFIQLVRLE